jgi:hypothetical protein
MLVGDMGGGLGNRFQNPMGSDIKKIKACIIIQSGSGIALEKASLRYASFTEEFAYRESV